MQQWISHNGKMVPAESMLFGVQSRAVRYGDGIFETMRYHKGILPLFDLHWERLSQGITRMGFDTTPHFSSASLLKDILALAEKNKVGANARIRLMLLRGNGGVFDPENNKAHVLIEAISLPEHYKVLNENGLVTGLYREAWKTTDSFSNLKSNNYLPYLMGASFARAQKWNEALILNQEGRICESTLANIFWIKGETIFTPPLSEGPVAGVMRKYLIQKFERDVIAFSESVLDETLLSEADAVFLTNAVSGIRWVRQFGGNQYGPEKVAPLYSRYIKTIFPE